MIDIRPILFVNGLLLVTVGAGMLMPMVIDLGYDNPDWQVFLGSALFTLFVGASLVIAYRTGSDALSLKQAFVLTASAWVVIPAFAAIPFVFSEFNMSYTDAFFEAMSGVTTTGSTVITGLDFAPPGLLMWRALLQWLGGVGIVVMAVAVLPMLQVGGMQLFKIEGYGTPDKILPRATQISGAITLYYLAITIGCVIALWLAGLTPFDAVAHAMTTVATGGFSTYDASIGHFSNHWIEVIVTIFMVLAAMPFVLQISALRGRPMALLKDAQTQGFLLLLVILIAVATAWMNAALDYSATAALREASFNIVSIITGTGFASVDYDRWGPVSEVFFFCIMFIGGCAGSTSCGIKI
ncbi:MAG: TrkH family potassium uptake protein, partial [Alphaproteobacteria bacterium]